MNSINSKITFNNKQRGATLFTALVFLLLMTIVSVSAAKIASLDALIAGNNQQVMMAFQQTDKTLKDITNPVVVITAIQDNDGVRTEWTKSLPQSAAKPYTVNAVRDIANRIQDYPCKSDGLATSFGSENAPSCYVFDLSSEDRLEFINIKDKHFRGAGKALPNTSNYTN